MKIDRFASIKNIGRLLDCTHKGPALEHYNLFYAENGRGKTTLCAILRSLKTGNNKYITGRKTLQPSQEEPSVSIFFSDDTDPSNSKEITYNGKTWNRTDLKIDIFDATFVARNIHSEEYVSTKHLTNLLQLVIGESSVALVEKLTATDNDIREKNTAIGEARNNVKHRMPGGQNLEKFVSLKDDPGIDTKIEATRKQLKHAQSIEEIRKSDMFSELPVSHLPENFIPTLSKTLDSASSDPENFTLVKKQIEHHEMHDKGEAWLSEGLSYIKDDMCPFCERGLDGLPIIDAYRQYFSEIYTAMIADIEELEKNIESAFGNAWLTSLKAKIDTNTARIAFWKQHVDIHINDLDVNAINVNVTGFYQAAKELLAKKRTQPLDTIEPDNMFNEAQAAYGDSVNLIENYNKEIKTINNKITDIKTSKETSNVSDIQKKLGDLEAIKMRHSNDVAPLCDTYEELTNAKKVLDADKKILQDQLTASVEQIMSDNQGELNKMLEDFNAGFRISKVKRSDIGGKPSFTYNISINGQDVPLGGEKTSVGDTSFRTTLSAGDKSILALAFFLLSLDKLSDSEREKRIIVFDDPFNSQDRSRRDRTADLLKEYGEKCQQLILLSHDLRFLRLVYSKLKRNKDDRQCFELFRQSGDTTSIRELDIAKATRNMYFANCESLKAYRDNSGSVEEQKAAVQNIRIVLEAYLHHRFPGSFSDDAPLGLIIAHIKGASEHPLHDVSSKLKSINDYSSRYHHPDRGIGDDCIDDGELKGYIDLLFTIIESN